MGLMVHEVLEKAAEASSRKEKVAILQQYNTLALRDILKGSFDDSIQFILPEGTPPYREDDAPYGYTMSSLQQQTKKFRYFIKGGPGENLPAVKRERMFIEILESVHKGEAQLVLLMKDKKMNGVYKGITKKLVQEVWPRLIIS
jgi:hypothetical protein